MILILAGALFTYFRGESGSIHLRRSQAADTYVSDKDGAETALPISLRLEEFRIDYYPDSEMPQDYVSELTLLPGNERITISMNHILKKDGYRFLQADYDEDLEGSILTVSRDPWGTGLTYAGYLVLTLAMLLCFCAKDSGFREAIRRLPAIPRPLRIALSVLAGGLLVLAFFLICRKILFQPLMPVLRSPLLWMHVLVIIVAYALFALMALNGIAGLVIRSEEKRIRLRDISLVALYPAVFLLAVGIMVGAVWANISWGCYWSWDPKETWALITFLVYAFILHGRVLKPLQRPRVFHALCIAAFLCVLITWLGVNLVLGGMHSYA